MILIKYCGVSFIIHAGLQCILPDQILIHLAQAQPTSIEDFKTALSSAPIPTINNKSSNTWCKYPTVLQQTLSAEEQESSLVADIVDAAAGQRPWVNPQLQEMLRPQLPGHHGSKRHEDPEAFKQRLVRFENHWGSLLPYIFFVFAQIRNVTLLS